MNFKLNRIGSIWDRINRNATNDNWYKIEKVISDRGLEILSEEWFKQYLDTSGIKHREEVATVSDLPTNDSLNTVRGVADDNKIYIKKESGWVPFQTIDISKINNVENQVEDIAINIKSFGVVGDGVTDDTQAIKNALESNGLSRLFFPKLKYRITQPIITTINNELEIFGDNAEFIIDFDQHEQYGILLKLSKPVDIKIDGINANGNKQVNNLFQINHESTSMNDVADVYISNSTFKGIKRQNTFTGGNCLTVRGGFRLVHFYNVNAHDAELPKDHGIAGSQGVTGVTTSSFSTNAYVKTVIFEKSNIKDIYSSDATYEADQDGLRCLAPPGVESTVIIKESNFDDCHGRFIKTQVQTTEIKNGRFTNSNANSTGAIDAQYGGGSVKDSKFIFKNGRDDNICVSTGSIPNISPPSMTVENIDVFLLNNSELRQFFSTYPRNGYIGTTNINNINIYGTAKSLLQYRINGNKNNLNVDNIFIEKLDSFENRPLSLIQVSSSGTDSPYETKVNVSNVYYQGNEKPLILLDKIAGIGATGELSSHNIVGFKEEKENSGLRSKFIKSNNGNAFSQIDSFNIEPGEEITLNVNTSYGTLINILVNSSIEGYINFYAYRDVSKVLNKGSNLMLGENIEPETGNYKIWLPERDKVTIKNDTGTRRTFSIFAEGNL